MKVILKFLLIITLLFNVNFVSAAETCTSSGGFAKGVKNACIQIKEKIETVRARTQTIYNKMNDLPKYISAQLEQHAGFNVDISNPTFKQMMNDAFQNFKDASSQQKSDITNFGNGENGTVCFSFKEDFKKIFNSLNKISDSLISTRSSDYVANLTILDSDSFINHIPCKLLYPVHFALNDQSDITTQSTGNRFSRLAEMLPKIDEPLVSLKQFYADDFSCSEVNAHREGYKKSAVLIGGAGLTLHLLGLAIDPSAITNARQFKKAKAGKVTDVTVGIHGYGSLSLEKPRKQKWLAAGIKGLGLALTGVSNYTSKKIRHCEVTTNQNDIKDMLCSITRNQHESCRG